MSDRPRHASASMRVRLRRSALIACLAATLPVACATAQTAQPNRHALPADWPAIPPVVEPRDDSQYVVLYGDPPGDKVYRRLYAVIFRLGTKADSVRAVFSRLHAVPVGGTDVAPLYIVRVPDPGPTAAGVDHVLSEFKRSAVIQAVEPWSVTPVRNYHPLRDGPLSDSR